MEIFRKFKKIVLRTVKYVLVVGTLTAYTMPVYAATPDLTLGDGGKLKDTKLFTGTLAILKDSAFIITALAAILTLVLATKEGLKYQAAEASEKNVIKKNVLSIVVTGIIVSISGAILTAIFSYFT